MYKQTVAVSLKDFNCNNLTVCLYKQFSGGFVFVTQAINYEILITVNTPWSKYSLSVLKTEYVFF